MKAAFFLLRGLRLLGFASILTAGIASTASAARYLVIPKNESTFSQIHSQWVLGTSNKAQSFLKNQDTQVVESLEAVGALVVESTGNLEALNRSAFSSVYVEKEFFVKTPRPLEFSNHELTKPWSYMLDAAFTPASLEILKKKKRAAPVVNPEQTAELDEEIMGTKPKLVRPWGIKAVRAEQAWDLSNKGEGVRVLILDTGIDRDHPAVKDNFDAGKNFTSEANGPYEYADTEGHGTHVAGTIGATELASGFVGVAPKVRLLSGKVCSADGCSNIGVVQGINWGILEKVDVINMSLGGPIGSQGERMATEKAEKAGVMIVAASGNDGVDHVSFPAAFSTVLAVGAVDVNLDKGDFSQWGPELDVVAPGVEVGSSVPMGSGRLANVSVTIGSKTEAVKNNVFMGSKEVPQGLELSLAFVKLGKKDDFKGLNLAGKMALVQRGEITFAEKVENAIVAGADGVVIFNNQDGLFNGALSEDGSTSSVPVVALEKAVGERMIAALAKTQVVRVEMKTERTDYADFSGTSMASPHVAGVAALVKATNKNLTPAQMREILVSTAKALTPNDDNQLGAGIVDAEKAVTKASELR